MINLGFFIFLSSGLFLGWSLGANDAANIFGTAVTSRMLRFRTAAILCAVFVIIGAVISGAGASHGLGKLGAVNALAGSFTVALSAAVTVYTMTKWGLPVSTTQAVVGGIIGWNLFSDSPTDMASLSQIAGTWVASPILGALFAWLIYLGLNGLINLTKPHLLWQDHWTRLGLVLAGVFGAYSLGANNIGNVMGVFVDSSPLQEIQIGELFALSGPQRLFLWGGIAIGAGVFFSRAVMTTIGKGIVPIGPLGGWVVVVSQALVLFIFSSASLQQFVIRFGTAAHSAGAGVQFPGGGWRCLRYSFSARHKRFASNPLVGTRKNSRGLGLHADQRGAYLLRDAVYRAKRLRTTGFYSSKRFERRFCAVNN